LVASRSTGLGPPPQQESSDHTWAFLAFRQGTSCSSGSNSAAVLDGSHCGRRGTLHSWDSDTSADRPAPCSLACSYFTSYPLFYHPLIESLPNISKLLICLVKLPAKQLTFRPIVWHTNL